MYTREEAEGKRLKYPQDTITEGIGINRLTNNFKRAHIDGAFKGTDREAVEMVGLAVGAEPGFARVWLCTSVGASLAVRVRRCRPSRRQLNVST